ncbi:unnamed protein product [Rotaria sordida]|uniref:Uncharacterized protein n=1 Tax=Rotaria sordida TaxID=392033 RepID=A0A814QFF8_9BILA|nr:unnamed protein product [Rotaria sordida]
MSTAAQKCAHSASSSDEDGVAFLGPVPSTPDRRPLRRARLDASSSSVSSIVSPDDVDCGQDEVNLALSSGVDAMVPPIGDGNSDSGSITVGVPPIDECSDDDEYDNFIADPNNYSHSDDYDAKDSYNNDDDDEDRYSSNSSSVVVLEPPVGNITGDMSVYHRISNKKTNIIMGNGYESDIAINDVALSQSGNCAFFTSITQVLVTPQEIVYECDFEENTFCDCDRTLNVRMQNEISAAIAI